MDKLTRIKNMEAELAALKAQVEKEESEKKVTKRWRADKGDNYWFVSVCRGVFEIVEMSDEYDKWRYSQGNYFRTEEQAEAHAKWQRLHTALYDYSIKDGWKPDWSDLSQSKYFLLWNYKDNEMIVNYWYTVNQPSIVCFSDRGTALQAVKEVLGDDAKFYLTYNGFGG